MTKKIYLLILIICTTILANDNVNSIDDLYLDFAVPDLSANVVLGVGVNDVARPGNIKKLAVEMLGAISNGKEVTPGIAFEIAPGKMVKKEKSSIDELKKSMLLRNLAISFATVNDDAGTKVAIGGKWVPIDKSDLLLDREFRSDLIAKSKLPDTDVEFQNLRHEFKTFLKGILGDEVYATLVSDEDYRRLLPLPKTKKEPVAQELLTVVTKIESLLSSNSFKFSNDEKNTIEAFVHRYNSIIPDSKKIKKQHEEEVNELIQKRKKELWNAFILQVGFGGNLNTADNTWANLRNERFSEFLNTSFPMTKIGQGVLHVQGTHFFRSAAEYEHELKVGGRTLFGNSDFRFSAEVMYTFANKKTAAEDLQLLRPTLGGEFKLKEGMWVELAVGTENVLDSDEDATFLSLFNLKYAIQKERRYELGE